LAADRRRGGSPLSRRTGLMTTSEPRTQRVFERSKRYGSVPPLTPLRCVRGSAERGLPLNSNEFGGATNKSLKKPSSFCALRGLAMRTGFVIVLAGTVAVL